MLSGCAPLPFGALIALAGCSLFLGEDAPTDAAPDDPDSGAVDFKCAAEWRVRHLGRVCDDGGDSCSLGLEARGLDVDHHLGRRSFGNISQTFGLDFRRP